MLRARAVVHGEGTKQAAIFIPMPANAVQPSVAITQFLGELAVEIPSAVTTMQSPSHFPDLHMDAAITVIKLFYAKFRHIRKSTVVVSVAALFNVRICRALYPNLFKKICGQKTMSSRNLFCRAVMPNFILSRSLLRVWKYAIISRHCIGRKADGRRRPVVNPLRLVKTRPCWRHDLRGKQRIGKFRIVAVKNRV